MKRKLLIPLCLVFSLAGNFLYAQQTISNYFIPNPLPKSPTSAGLGKYGDYKVNYFTGVPEISIPLYNIQSGGLEVPITLSYHASGVKVSEVSSWVGLGWSVSCGGSITRKILGQPDESGTGFIQPGGYSWRHSVDVTINNSDIDFVANVLFANLDSQPDIFSYSFPGHQGNFFFEASQGFKPALVPFAPIKITHSTPVSPYYNIDFNILDEHGNSYSFGNTYKETVNTVSSGHGTDATTGWMLEQILSQDRKDTVKIAYRSQVVNYPDVAWQQDLVEDNIVIHEPGSPYLAQYTPHKNNGTISTSTGEQDADSIMFKNGKVLFDLNGSQRLDGQIAHALQAIRVMAYNFSTKTYQLQKKIVFFQSYFHSNTRMRLDSIEVQDAAGATIQHYNFVYNNSITVAGSTVYMPAYGSFAKDYWGYYNGKDNSTSLIPQFTYPSNNGAGVITNYNIGLPNPAANNRNTDTLYTQLCMLKSIYYPTGGHTDFTYQNNPYIDPVTSVPGILGSLRIASIKSYDGISATPIVKTYQYNSFSTNFVYDFNNFTDSKLHQYWAVDSHSLPYLAATEMYNAFVSNPSIDPTPFDQALTVYPSVTEYIGTPSANVGRTNYIFRNHTDDRETSMGGAQIIQNNFYERGQLLSKTDYIHKSDGSYQVVKKDSNSYTAFPVNNHEIAGWQMTETIWVEGPGAPVVAHYDAGSDTHPNSTNGFVAQSYSIPSDDNYLTGTTSYVYDTNNPSNYTTSTIAYKYDDTVHQQVTRTYHTDSRGNTHITRTKYAADYLSGTTTHNLLLDTMLSRNMQADLIEKWDTIKNVAAGINAVSSGQFNQYQFGNIANTILPYKVSVLNTVGPFTGFVPSLVVSGSVSADSHYTQMVRMDSYDTKNNIAQYTPRNSNSVSYIWDYNFGEPIAEVKNALLANIAYTSFEADGKGNWSYSGTPVTDATAPSGLRSYPLSTGNITSPLVDASKNYVVSYWSNAGPATVNSAIGTGLRSANGWTYFEHTITGTSSVTISGTVNIDELRIYPTDAQMTTYNYTTDGLSSMEDTKGLNSYFEYDFFQRLKNLKDWSGNIITNYGYHTFDQTIGNDVQSAVVTRNNCPSGTTPQHITYIVPASKYLSSTKASANAEAIYDLDTYGQAKANAVCGCPVQMITITLINSTGLSGFNATFSGPYYHNFNFPPGTSYQTIEAGTYTLNLPAVSPFNNHTWTLGTRTPVVAPSANFTNVIIATGSSDLTVKVQ